MQKKRKQLLTIVIIILCFVIIAYFGGMLGSGSYGYAQQYKFSAGKNKLTKAVEELKNESKSLNLPDAINDPDGLDTLTSHYNASIYDYDKKIIFVFFIESDYNNSNRSSIYLVSINKSLDVRNYKLVNRDMDRTENLEVKREFEEFFLNKLKIEYKDEGNNMFIFWK